MYVLETDEWHSSANSFLDWHMHLRLREKDLSLIECKRLDSEKENNANIRRRNTWKPKQSTSIVCARTWRRCSYHLSGKVLSVSSTASRPFPDLQEVENQRSSASNSNKVEQHNYSSFFSFKKKEEFESF
jgi:hypothetical protein